MNYAEPVHLIAASPARTMPPDMARGVDTTPLSNELRRRRLASERTNNKISQAAIAREMGCDQSYVTRLEGGTRSLHALSGDQVWKLLTGYRYTTLEIKAAVERYGLNIPSQLALGSDERSPGTVTVMHEGSVSHPSTPTPQTMPDALEGRFPAKDLSVRDVEATDLVAQDVDAAPVGARIWIHNRMGPDDGRPAIVEQDGVQILVMWPVTSPIYALPADQTADVAPVRVDPAKATFARRVVSISMSYL